MDDHKFGSGVRADWMTVNFRGWTMGSPSGVSDGNLRCESLCDVNVGGSNLLAEPSDFAHFLKERDFTGLVPVNDETSRIVSTVFLAGKTIAENLKDLLSILSNR
jgi:hypothetical protein